MKQQNRVLALLLTAAVVSLQLAGCVNAVPAKREKISLTFKIPTLATSCVTNPDIKEAFDMFETSTREFAAQYKDADVTFNLVKFDLADETKYIPDCFDKEDAADLLYEDFFNMSTYIYTGRMVPLDDILDDAWKQDMDSSYWSMGSAQGKVYMLPFLSRQNVLGYHKSMLLQCGLDRFISDEKIGTWTLEQWEEILKTLKEKLPENTYALSMYAKNEQSDTHTMTWIRSHGSDFFNGDGYFNLETPEGIAGLKWLKDSYDKGYYPPECENLVSRDCGNLFWNNQLAIKLINGPGEDTNNRDIGLVNFPSADGKGLATMFVTGFGVFDNGNPKKVAAAKAFLKYFYGTDKYLDYSAGNMPASKKVAEKYHDKIYRLDAFRENADRVVDFMDNNPNWRGVRSVFYKYMQKLFRGELTPEETASGLDEDCNAAIRKGREEGKLHQ